MAFRWWIIFSESSRERFFDSSSNSWNFRPPMPLSSQTRKRRSTSRNLALICWRSCVSAIVGKIMQRIWLFLFVAVRRTPQIVKREERDRMQHRKLRPRGCSHQTEGITIFWIYRQPRDILSDHKKWRTPCSICYDHLQKHKRYEMHLLHLQKLGVIVSVKLSKNKEKQRNFARW